MKRIVFFLILFAALIEFAFERARFDLWIMVFAIVAILWNVAGPTLRSRPDASITALRGGGAPSSLILSMGRSDVRNGSANRVVMGTTRVPVEPKTKGPISGAAIRDEPDPILESWKCT
jgi:hypothetical protein